MTITLICTSAVALAAVAYYWIGAWWILSAPERAAKARLKFGFGAYEFGSPVTSEWGEIMDSDCQRGILICQCPFYGSWSELLEIAQECGVYTGSHHEAVARVREWAESEGEDKSHRVYHLRKLEELGQDIDRAENWEPSWWLLPCEGLVEFLRWRREIFEDDG